MVDVSEDSANAKKFWPLWKPPEGQNRYTTVCHPRKRNLWPLSDLVADASRNRSWLSFPPQFRGKGKKLTTSERSTLDLEAHMDL